MVHSPSFKKRLGGVSRELRSPSLESCSGTPNVSNHLRRHATSPRAPEFEVPVGVKKTSEKPDNRSPATR